MFISYKNFIAFVVTPPSENYGIFCHFGGVTTNAFTVMLFLYGPNHFLVKRVSILLFMVLILTSVLKFLFDKFRLIRENAFLAIIFVQGMVWINGNLGKSKYAFYEFWFAYCYMSQFCSLMTWVNLKLKYLIKMY